MLKYLMRLRHRKAFTLVELVIVIAILALLMTCVAAFSTPVQQMVNATSASVDAISANKIIGDYIENRLAFASRVDVVYAIDAVNDPANTAIMSNATGNKGGFVAVKEMLGTGSTTSVAGVLVLRYEADPNEPEKATYKLYDIPIKSTDLSYSAAAITSTELKHPVFADHFYNNSQNLILPQLNATANKVRNSVYVTVDIIPYDIEEDYLVRDASGNLDPASLYIKPSTMKDYYANPASLDTIASQRSGAPESVTFALQNMTSTTQWSLKNPTGGTGSDILMFYFIPRY